MAIEAVVRTQERGEAETFVNTIVESALGRIRSGLSRGEDASVITDGVSEYVEGEVGRQALYYSGDESWLKALGAHVTGRLEGYFPIAEEHLGEGKIVARKNREILPKLGLPGAALGYLFAQGLLDVASTHGFSLYPRTPSEGVITMAFMVIGGSLAYVFGRQESKGSQSFRLLPTEEGGFGDLHTEEGPPFEQEYTRQLGELQRDARELLFTPS